MEIGNDIQELKRKIKIAIEKDDFKKANALNKEIDKLYEKGDC